MRRILWTVLIAGWAAAQLPAQLRITGLEGLASKASDSAEITLDSSLLQMAGGFLAGNSQDKDQAKIKALLTGLKSIMVKSFKFKEDGQYRIEDLDPIRAQLRAPGWSRIINVQRRARLSEIYTRTEQGKVVGFAIIAAKPRELTVVAIEGTIDLNDLSKLGGLGVPAIPAPEPSKDQAKKGK